MTWRRQTKEDHRPRPAARKVISVLVLSLLAVVSCGTTASPLQAPAAAQTLHPDLFRDLDLNQVTRAFYRDFMGYPLSAADLREIFQLSA